MEYNTYNVGETVLIIHGETDFTQASVTQYDAETGVVTVEYVKDDKVNTAVLSNWGVRRK